MTSVKESEHRRTVRLHLDQGLVLVHAPGLPAAACSMVDLSEGGCRCHFPTSGVDADWVRDLTGALYKGARVEVELFRPPHLVRVPFCATLTHVERTEHADLDLGMVFVDAEPASTDLLRNVLLKLACAKIRTGDTHYRAPEPERANAPVAQAGSAPAPAVEALKIQRARRNGDTSLAGKPLEEVLAALNLMSAPAAAMTVKDAVAAKMPLHRYLLRQRQVLPSDLCRALALQSGLAMTNLKEVNIPSALTGLFTYLTMLRHEFVPFAESKEALCVAAAAALPNAAMLEIMRVCKKEVLVFLAPLDQIRGQLFKLRPRAPFQERHHARIKASVPVAFEYCDEHGVNLGEAIHDGHTVNLSEGGFLIEAPAATEHSNQELMEHRAHIRIEFASATEHVHALCVVRHIDVAARPAEGHLPWKLGVEIVHINSEDVKVLKDICMRVGMEHMQHRNRGFDLPSHGT